MIPLFDLSLKINGFPIDKSKKQLAQFLLLDTHQKKSYLDKKRSAIVEFHLQNNLFYQNLTKNKVAEWHDLPILTKADLQQPLVNRLSNGYQLSKVYVNKTSGSSGHPFTFAIDKEAHALTWANTIHLFGQYNIDFNQSLQARFYGIPLDFIGNKKERFKDFLSHRYRFNIFDLSDNVLENYLSVFAKKPFEYINGYTNCIVAFAQFLDKKNIVLKSICPSLKVVICTSEMLFEDDKALMQKTFGVPVVNEYGASELGIIAFENPMGIWEVNNNTLFVEVVDENGTIVPNGSEGRILVTSLYNKAHPFIRYEIGDIGSIEENNGLLAIKKLSGRTSDMAVLSNGKKIPGLTFYYVTKSIIKDKANVKEFVIKQTSLNDFTIQYVSENELNEDEQIALKRAFETYVGPDLNLTLQRHNVIERTKSGKLKQFIGL